MRPCLLFTPLVPIGLTLAAPTTVPATGLTLTELASNPDLLAATFSSRDASSLAKRAYATTANELTDGTPCRDVTVIYARGTTQDGNIGAAGDVGPLMLNNLSAIIGADKLAVQGVDYNADIIGFLGNLVGVDDAGAQTMTDLVTQAHTQCPSTKIVMSGYSQGGQLVHAAANNLKSNQAAVDQVAAVMIFGDPDNGDAVGSIPAGKVKIICHDGDNICAGGVIILPPHLNYQIDALTGAQFVASKVK